jgi:hypothetical protein
LTVSDKRGVGAVYGCLGLGFVREISEE